MKDIYAALSGANSAWANLQSIANNLANAETRGYRESRVTFQLEGGKGLAASYAAPGEMGYNRDDGELKTDGVSTHLALRGDGFFALADGTYTRDGAFRLDEEGQLCTEDGMPVEGDGGAIQLQPGEGVSVGVDGSVTGSKSGEIGRIKIAQLTNALPIGGARWKGTAGEPEAGAVSVVQGALEGSNVDAMRGMVEMIEASRFFEAQQKAIQTSDEMRQRINKIGGS